MSNTFTAVFEPDGDCNIGYCREVPGANGRGIFPDECRESLREAIRLILDDRRVEQLRGDPDDAIREQLEVA